MALNLETPLSQLPRIGKKYYKQFHKLGLATVRDLLYYFPFRYDDFSNIVPIAKLELNKIATIQGKILDVKNIRTFRKRMILTEAIIQDKTGTIKAIWFNQPFLVRNLKKDDQISLSGKLSFGPDGHYISNPGYEIMRFGKVPTHTAGLIPVYPETAGISSRLIRYALKLALPVISQIKEFLPSEIIKNQEILPLKTALHQIHFPKTKILAEKARQRLAFDELFLIQLSVIQQKKALQKQTARAIPFNKELVQSFVKSLPFKLTNSQKIAAWDILQDIAKPMPMNRLLNGDVGSGKTVVAAIAALETAKTGSQAAFMAPTEILAQQHFKEITKLLKRFGIKVGLLTGSEKKFSEDTDIVIGTHALIQKGVKFRDLALVIIDEQHRFGVEQRAALQKATTPHFLTLTATPIPRTLALTIYGDLDISLLKEMPKGRQKIITKIVEPANRQQAYEFIRQQIKQGRQTFVICPRIEGRESNVKNGRLNIWADVKAVKEEYEKLTKEIFPDLKVAMLHGRMRPKEKEKIMTDFSGKKTDVLVSTSVVEVGIDIPNATVMFIEGSERFGLAQLHQFRGRVGRGKHQSYCFLFTDNPARTTQARLKALLKCENGFELAEKDLKIRGPGELYGIRQSGLPDLAMANLGNLPLVEQTRKEANNLLDKDPRLKTHPLLQEKLKEFHRTVHFE